MSAPPKTSFFTLSAFADKLLSWVKQTPPWQTVSMGPGCLYAVISGL